MHTFDELQRHIRIPDGNETAGERLPRIPDGGAIEGARLPLSEVNDKGKVSVGEEVGVSGCNSTTLSSSTGFRVVNTADMVTLTESSSSSKNMGHKRQQQRIKGPAWLLSVLLSLLSLRMRFRSPLDLLSPRWGVGCV